MKKLIHIAIALVAVTGVAAGQTKPAPKQKTPEITCPIMKGHKVDVQKATKDKMFSDYKGRRYFFCCGGCKPAFEKDPAKYASAPSLPTPKKK